MTISWLAQEAGAHGVIIVNRFDSSARPSYTTSGPIAATQITIPVIKIGNGDGLALIELLRSGYIVEVYNVTAYPDKGDGPEFSGYQTYLPEYNLNYVIDHWQMGEPFDAADPDESKWPNVYGDYYMDFKVFPPQQAEVTTSLVSVPDISAILTAGKTFKNFGTLFVVCMTTALGMKFMKRLRKSVE